MTRSTDSDQCDNDDVSDITASDGQWRRMGGDYKVVRISRVSCSDVTAVKTGFHYASSRPEFTARVRPSTQVSTNAPEFTGRQLGP